MKTKLIPVLWIFFFTLSLFILGLIARQYIEPREIIISPQQAEEIGNKIWQNEGAGKAENLIVWNKGEDFPSLGIGHFIWFPAGVETRFKESFPDLIRFIAKTRTIPRWLQDQPFPPWQSHEDFHQNSHPDFNKKLRRFLQDTTAEQTQFMVLRLQTALPKILKTIKSGFSREAVRTNFYHVAMQTNGVYALVDYVNFKGEGIAANEHYKNQGWGLLQVLENMDRNPADTMQAFIKSADQRLTRRVANAPRDERRWLPGWRKRLKTYASTPSKPGSN